MHSSSVKDYTYILPEELIAQHPANPPTNARLLHYSNHTIAHYSSFLNLTQLLPPKSTLLLNNTKVIPARLRFRRKTGATVEVFLLEPFNVSIAETLNTQQRCLWKCMIGNLKKWKDNETLYIQENNLELRATLRNRATMTVLLEWDQPIIFQDLILALGAIPLPPYITRQTTLLDKEDYQTAFSEVYGAVAAPTAGLHFSQKMLTEIQKLNHSLETLTLHVSAGTFLPIKVDDFVEHPMHQEQIIISRKTVENILINLSSIIAIGTTSLRTIESVIWYGYDLMEDSNAPFFIPKLRPYLSTKNRNNPTLALEAVLKKMSQENSETLYGKTEIMIFPSYEFQIVNGLVTNFHQPNSTLLLLIATFIGPSWKKVYQEAKDKQYRFLSYGDACFFERS